MSAEDKENPIVHHGDGHLKVTKGMLNDHVTTESDTSKPTKQKHGLQETNINHQDESDGRCKISDDFVKKIRKSSASWKPKEERKVALVAAHKHVLSFNPRGKRTLKGDKPFAVPAPDPTGHYDHEYSPMVTDAPLVKIRNLMKRVPRDVVDIDANNDPWKCSVYAQEICDYLQAVETRYTFPSKYLHNQKEVTPHMRAVLVDWIIQVQVHLELTQNTLHMCVALIDRLLVKTVVHRAMLQLLGVTTLLLAAKYYERFPPELDDLCHLTDNTYSPQQIIQTERVVLQKLNFDLNVPCPFIFLDRFLMVLPCEKTPIIRSMAMYFLDLSLIEVSFVHHVASMKAASAIFLSREIIGCDVIWDKSFVYYTKYSERDLENCVKDMRELMATAKNSPHTGAPIKYSHSHFHGVSNYNSLMHISIHPASVQQSKEDEKPDGTEITF